MLLMGSVLQRKEVITLLTMNPGFSPLQKRMLEDDDFFNVSPHDVAMLLKKMASRQCSREEVIRIRRKYDIWLDDKESRLMAELGLDYDNHVIGKQPREYGLSLKDSEFTINGYRVNEWKMLTDEDYVPPPYLLKLAQERLTKIGDTAALEVLDMKYRFISENRIERILRRHGLPLDVEFESLTQTKIDGITFHLWKLLNDDEFVPKTTNQLISTIRQMREKGDEETADFLEDKYYWFLYPEKDKKVSEQEIEDARQFFREMFPNRDIHF